MKSRQITEHSARLAAALACAALCSGCGEDEAARGTSGYRVQIRETSYGIPHVLADDIPSAVAGLGYVGARDYGCILLDQIVRVRSERAKFFGPGNQDANITSDFAMLVLGIHDGGERGLATQTPELRAAVHGYVAGFNRYLSEHELAADCAGKPWARPLTATDLFAYYYWLAQLASADPLLSSIGAAVPPSAQPTATAASLPNFRTAELGSNGWAIGAERSASGRGMLVANPHFPWEGNRRFYESHITVPGVLNVYGASLLGAPVINIGFNEHVAWTHTVTTARHFTLYRVNLSPGDPTSYLYDGQPRAMEREAFSIDVLEPGGETRKVARTMYRTHYGPMVSIAALGGWTDTTAYTMRNANEDNFAIGEQWLRMNLATSLDDLKRANEQVQGIPWVNTMAVDAQGTALYMDASRTPNLNETALARYRDALATDPLTQVVDQNGATLLDGSDSMFEWQDAGAPGEGTVPFSRSPQLERRDFVFNANDSYWLTNPTAPLTGYSILFGPEGAPSTPRTRTNALMLTEMSADGASGSDGKFTFEELAGIEFNQRASLAEVLLTQVVERCTSAGPVTVNGNAVEIASACEVLRNWDRRLSLDSVGAVLWREFLASFSGATRDQGALFADPFDRNQPLSTPRTLIPAPSSGDDPVLVSIAKAKVTLEGAGFGISATLRQAQRTKKGNEFIPIPGGSNLEGAFNIVGYSGDNGTLLPGLARGAVVSPPTGLTSEGYLINVGSSFMMTLEYTPAGPHAEAVLSYSQSTDPSSPHFADQTRVFSEAHYRPIAFTEQQIAADPALQTMTLEISP
ncbi:MAG TPA: acylase [Polyangiaceae bacterium]|nr:acylase [Polyangiaceae bacterium]